MGESSIWFKMSYPICGRQFSCRGVNGCLQPCRESGLRFTLNRQASSVLQGRDRGAPRARLGLCANRFAGTKARVLALEDKADAVNPWAGHDTDRLGSES